MTTEIVDSRAEFVGFIGQGFIGKNYSNDFENRGIAVVRYALEEPYVQNKAKLKNCKIIFIAVPTPTTPDGFDDSIVRNAVGLVAPGTIVVIKSTLAVGATESIQKEYPDLFIMHSPEFLAEKTAAYDAAHPTRNIIGIPKDTVEYRQKAEQVLSILPASPFTLICAAKEAELIKYAANCFLFTKVLYANLIADLAAANGVGWENIMKGIGTDPRIGPSHLRIMDTSGHPGAAQGRGAGGHCFIKDFAALREMFERSLPNDDKTLAILRAMEARNCQYLRESKKDLDLLGEVYGVQFPEGS
ncbi:MAG TPA: hypothetical protein VJ579_04780 [Candidatus Paceibacterota bacterium]|nr:hypothetical protein [Candidatus Paceibacterota bacterium]